LTDACTFIQCSKCGSDKLPHEFELRKDTKKLRKCCRACYQAYKRASHHNGSKSYWLNEIYRAAKRRSIIKGKEFKLTKQDILDALSKQKNACALTGRFIDFSKGTRLSIDKIDPCGIYERSNIQLVCAPANYAKHVLTNEEFIQLCKEVVNFYEQRNRNRNTKARAKPKGKFKPSGR